MLTWQQKYENLVTAVRELATNSDLLHLVGPSKNEANAAEARMRHLDAISPLCEWGNLQPSAEASQARELHKRVLDLQTVYEERYC